MSQTLVVEKIRRGYRGAPSDPNSLEAQYYQAGLEGKNCPKLAVENPQARGSLEDWWVLGTAVRSEREPVDYFNDYVHSRVITAEERSPYGTAATV